MAQPDKALTVAVTGATGDLGQLLLPVLEADAQVKRIIALDVAQPNPTSAKLEYRRLDLLGPAAEASLREVLDQAHVDAVFHLAFVSGRVNSGAFAHELEVVGSLNLLTAASRAKVGRLILPSLTALYGARPSHPAVLLEEAPLLGCPGSRYIQDKLQVEEQLETFRRRNPETEVAVLRFAPIVGPRSDNPVTRWLKTRLVPTLLGFDPLWQVVHEDDAVRALHRALHAKASGAFNVVGRGVLALSDLIRHAGARSLPLPRPVALWALRTMQAAGMAAFPTPLLDYLHYSWVSDSRRAELELGFVAQHHAVEAACSLRGN